MPWWIIGGLVTAMVVIGVIVPQYQRSQRHVEGKTEDVLGKGAEHNKQTEIAIDGVDNEPLPKEEEDTPPPPKSPEAHLQDVFDKRDAQAKSDQGFIDAQQKELDDLEKKLNDLPEGDPERAEIAKEIDATENEQKRTVKSRVKHAAKRKDAHDAIHRRQAGTGVRIAHGCTELPGWYHSEGVVCGPSSGAAPPAAHESGHESGHESKGVIPPQQ